MIILYGNKLLKPNKNYTTSIILNIIILNDKQKEL
nr:MAG TPA: hypothetical protein [Bacteriophage sp.]